MAHCVNHKHPEVSQLSEQFELSPKAAAAVIAVWQERTGEMDRFPTIEEFSRELEPVIQQETIVEPQQYSQYLESLNKPNTNPILRGNQEEQVKKFAELQERLNNKEFVKGAKNTYESSEELQQFGTQEQYNDYIARVSLGIIKNPSSGEYNYTSEVKDIVYHGTRYNILNKVFQIKKAGSSTGGFRGAAFFTNNKEWADSRFAWNDSRDDGTQEGNFVFSALLNIKTPTQHDTVFDFNKSVEEGFIENLHQDLNIEIRKYFPPIFTKRFEVLVGYDKKSLSYTYTFIDRETKAYKTNRWGKYEVPKELTEYEFLANINNKEKNNYLEDKEKLTSYYKQRSFDIIKAKDLEKSTIRTPAVNKGSDAVISKQDDGSTLEYAVFEPEQIHVLSSKKDLEMFKNFINFTKSEYAKYGDIQQFKDYIMSKNFAAVEEFLVVNNKIDRKC